MKIKSNAKINLGLSVLRKRKDGYHDIQSIFLPIPWYDEIEIKESNQLQFSSSGISIDGDIKNNLCVKAFSLLEEKYSIPPVRIHLKKQIPVGAGLGGGSSNAAFTLKAIDQLFKLKLPQVELEKLADKIGSDCTFFIKNKPALVTGKGEIINTNIELSLSTNCIVVYPNIHINTQEAYGMVMPKENALDFAETCKLPLESWQSKIVNDFQAPLLKHYPQLEKIKQSLIKMGANYVSMSGSGSSLYAFFDNKPTVEFELPKLNWKAFELNF